MNIVFMGSSEFAVPSLRRLGEDGYNILSVYTQTDKPAGRGQTLHYSPVKTQAMSMGLDIKQPMTLRDTDTQNELKALNPDLIVVVAYGLFLPQTVLDIPKYGCINVHPSLLPRHRGAAPVVSTILSGDKWGGITIMKMDNGWDTGDMLRSASVLIRKDDTTVTLMDKLSYIASDMLAEILPLWVEGKIPLIKQDPDKATYFKMMKKEDGLIDWNDSSLTIFNKVRALQPWPGAFTHVNGKLLKIISCCNKEEPADGVPGTVIKTKNSVSVVTGSGTIVLDTVQLEGKKAMPAIDLARGNGLPDGAVLS
jgi:methionyl-tRNA formyltransferase